MPSFDPGDGHLLHYLDHGAGRPVVLLHGWACHAGYFSPQIEALADRFRLIAPDLRGHRHSHRPGDTPDLPALARDLRALIVATGLDAAILVGWSMGALVAFEYLRRYGAAGLGGLAIIDMTPRVADDTGWQLGLIGGYYPAQTDRACEQIRQDWPRWVEGFLPTVMAGGTSGNPALLAWIGHEMQDCDPVAMAALWRALTAADYRSDIAGITVPALILRGAGSQLYGADTAAWLAGSLPDATVVTIPDAGHAPQLERPQAFNQALAAFVERLG